MSTRPFSGVTATRVTGATAIKASAGTIYGLLVCTSGAVAPVVTVYDDPDSATAPIVIEARPASASSVFVDLSPFGGIAATTGIYVDASSWTTASAVVYWA